MITKKTFAMLEIFFILIVLTINLVPAEDLKISKQAISDVVIKELDRPAVFNFSITNLGNTDAFKIYTLVSINFAPSESFRIDSGQTKKIQVEVYPTDSFKKKMNGHVVFDYFIKGTEAEQKDRLMINIISLKDAFAIGAENINPDSNSVKVDVINVVNSKFENIKFIFSSAFFDDVEKIISLEPYEKYEFIVPLNKEKMKRLFAGNYILSASATVDDVTTRLEGDIKLLEKSGLSVSRDSSGILTRKNIIRKTNEGNIPTLANITIRKNIISRLFSTFSPQPVDVKRQVFFVDYFWQKDLRPAETLEVVVTTSWIFPFLLLLAIAVIGFLVFFYSSSDLILKKKISFVKTKGGEFALKVSIIASSRKFIENIKIVDKLPPLVKLYNKFGATPPSKIDVKNRRLFWDLKTLDFGEKRVFSYIIYSKVGVIGRFELPPATGIFERNNKVHETHSNRAFFVNEPKKIEKSLKAGKFE